MCLNHRRAIIKHACTVSHSLLRRAHTTSHSYKFLSLETSMIITRLVRSFSTRPLVEQWFKAVQSSSIPSSIFNHDQSLSSDLIKDIFQRWAVEYPNKDALYICDRKNHAYEKFTYKDVHTEAMRLRNVFAGPELNLAAGNNVGEDAHGRCTLVLFSHRFLLCYLLKRKNHRSYNWPACRVICAFISIKETSRMSTSFAIRCEHWQSIVLSRISIV